MMFGANTVAAPAAAPILRTLLLLIVPSVFFSILCRFFAFCLGIESPFSRLGLASNQKPLLVVMTLLEERSYVASRMLIQLPHKGDQFERREFSAETFE
jgi:hypothetical protein